MPKTAIEIINETVDYYSKDPKGTRAIDPVTKRCSYLDSSGRVCAVGRCLNMDDPEVKKRAIRISGSVLSLCCHSPTRLNKMLNSEYGGHSLELWSDLQTLHDSPVFWDEKGLSPEGEKFVKGLIREHGRDSASRPDSASPGV